MMEDVRKADFVHHPQVLAYGRYIDDALAPIFAQDRSNCSTILLQLELGLLDIEWDIVEGGEGTNHEASTSRYTGNHLTTL